MSNVKPVSEQVSEPVNERIFAVYRSGVRVSDSIYTSERDPQAVSEKRYWEGILNRWPDGTRVSVKEIRWRN